MRDVVGNMLDWIEKQPAWIRPALYGALLVPAWGAKNGAPKGSRTEDAA